MKRLETRRLVLRGWRDDDLQDMYSYARLPEVGPNAGWKPHEDLQESIIILKNMRAAADSWAIQLKETGRVIGSVGLHADEMRPGLNARMLGYVLAPAHWGQGLATEAARRVIRHAFDDIGLDILSVGHYPHNTRSEKVILRCGFVKEGCMRHARVIYNGAVMDLVCYSMLRQEYLETRSLQGDTL